MDLQIPLNRLKFGHEDGAGINARVAGRNDGIAELAANLHAQGQIENLIVKPCGEGFYSVANGNRRLAAFHMIYGEASEQPINCTLHEVDETKGFEISLTTAVTAKQLHPVDQYEAFARLQERGKSNEEIARDYGMTAREVEQALALGGRLSPNARDLWRRGLIKTEVAQALPMAGDHDTQDQLLKKLNLDGDYDDVSAWDIKRALKIDEAGRLVEFVGVETYVAAGGKVTRDLFGTDHKVSDAKLAKRLADQRLEKECKALMEAGWSFAVPVDTLGQKRWSYTALRVHEGEPTAQESLELAELRAQLPDDDQFGDPIPFAGMTGRQQRAALRIRAIERDIALRPYTPALMAKAGCFVGIDDDGMLDIEYGKVKPEERKAAATETKKAKKGLASRIGDEAAAGEVATEKSRPEPAAISNALRERLEAALIAATKEALMAAIDTEVLKSPLSQLLARVVGSQINVNGSSVHIYSHGVKDKLAAMREALPAVLINGAIAKHFDAEDYFSNAPKAFVVKAISETINADEARKAAAGSKAELAKFAMTNVAKSGWLPKELRTLHYVAPAAKKAADKNAGTGRPEQKAAPSTREKVNQAKAQRETKRAAVVAKRVAKTQAKKRKR